MSDEKDPTNTTTPEAPAAPKVKSKATEPTSDRDRQPTGVTGADGIWRPN